MTTDRRTFILCDNQEITRLGMISLIASIYPECRCLEASDRSALIRHLENYPDAIVVIDYALSDIGRPENLIVIMRRFEKSDWIVFSSDLSTGFIRCLGSESQLGIVLKDCDLTEISAALCGAMKREGFHCSQIDGFIRSGVRETCVAQLTPAETEILVMIAQGFSVKQIASKRISSVHTIVTHKKNIFRKLDVNTVYEATRYALMAGLVELSDYYI
ncbi:response regulator transcription factor [Duncaniella sp.]|uniref:response regulator transcription factor n=1 Tax=Duncaniella sp. TaxID=2518496 RepID=UPI0023D2C331|nr:response regulator transcription factor [Duncaniella sp.]MDE5690369.1 response regulator transcription factor [Duncaniella sp.]MDE5905324.1 response regulator transcription factor [Duncaniella sp.]